ncbi:MAG: hypothetical protein JNK12_23300 [Acidimicrobiales bacterium]|nr:hypothetical protein [Acidimicrobiales bacterium]
MRAHRHGVLGVVLGLLIFGAVAAPAAAAAPDARSITVSPSTDLVDGQEVEVAGTGWPAGAELWVTVCAAGTGHCGGTSIDVVAAPDGSFATTLRPRVQFTGPDLHPVDCLLTPCEVRAWPDTLNQSAAEAIAFDPNAPLLPPPTIAVDPATDLVDGQTVTVTGDGYAPDQRYWVAQCPASAVTLDEGCVVYGDATWASDGFGHVVAEPALLARLLAIPRPTDCRVDACTVSLVDLAANLSIEPRATIGFDPDSPLLPRPEIEARPSTGLRDGQTVRVVGSAFDPGEQLLLSECIAIDATPEVCDLDGGRLVTVDADGTVDAELAVHATFTQATGDTADCERWGCVVRAYRHANTDDDFVDAAIDFAPAPSPAAPVAVTPRFTG